MRTLITGANGTIGAVLCGMLVNRDVEVVKWNRTEIPVDDYHKMKEFIKRVEPDILVHLAYASQLNGSADESWKINYEWPSELAWITKLLGVKFIFASTNHVFANKTQGPYQINFTPDAESGYGFEKRKAEEKILSQNENSIIVRLGWQIGKQPGSNNMIDFFQRKTKELGNVPASHRWMPACSFLEDTCEKLIEVAQYFSPGIYAVDSNERWNFFEIAKALNHLHGHPWKIVATEDYIADTRMIDERLKMISLRDRLVLLSETSTSSQH